MGGHAPALGPVQHSVLVVYTALMPQLSLQEDRGVLDRTVVKVYGATLQSCLEGYWAGRTDRAVGKDSILLFLRCMVCLVGPVRKGVDRTTGQDWP